MDVDQLREENEAKAEEERERGPVSADPEAVQRDASVDYLEQIVAMGGMVEGASDESLESFRVVA